MVGDQLPKHTSCLPVCCKSLGRLGGVLGTDSAHLSPRHSRTMMGVRTCSLTKTEKGTLNEPKQEGKTQRERGNACED